MDNPPKALANNYIRRQMQLDTSQDDRLSTIAQIKTRRPIVDELKNDCRQYIDNPSSARRWLVMPGLRGMGKTTALLQLYLWLKRQYGKEINLLYLSLDQLAVLGISLTEALNSYEAFLKSPLQRLQKPTLLLLDEVQADLNWGQFLKTIYDSTQVFCLCTGSSATNLQMNLDIAHRRALIKKVYPLSFAEHNLMTLKTPINLNLAEELRNILYFSDSASALYNELQAREKIIKQASDLLKPSPDKIKAYLKTGTIPLIFSQTQNEIYQFLQSSIESTLTKDLPLHGRSFRPSVIAQIKRLLACLAISDENLSFEKIKQLIGISTNDQLKAIFDVLVAAGILVRIPASGKDFMRNRHPVRYNFVCPAMRASYYDLSGERKLDDSRHGRLLEDMASFYYQRQFNDCRRGRLTYPYNRNGLSCDFILQVGQTHKIALEFGLGKKTVAQVQQTMEKVDCRYGIVFSKSDLRLDAKTSIVQIPLNYFLLT